MSLHWQSDHELSPLMSQSSHPLPLHHTPPVNQLNLCNHAHNPQALYSNETKNNKKKDHTAWIQLTCAGATFAWCSAAELTVTAAEWKHSCLRCVSTRQQPTAHDCSGGQYIQTATVLQRMKKACLVLMETLTAGSAPIRITWAEEQQILCYSSSCRSAVCIFMLKRVLNYASSRV